MNILMKGYVIEFFYVQYVYKFDCIQIAAEQSTG